MAGEGLGLSNGGDGRRHVRSTEGGGAGDHDVGTRLGCGDGGFGPNAAIDLNVKAQVVRGAVFHGGFDLGHYFGHEGLAAKAGHDGHDEEKVDIGQVGNDGLEGGCGIESKPGLAS